MNTTRGSVGSQVTTTQTAPVVDVPIDWSACGAFKFAGGGPAW